VLDMCFMGDFSLWTSVFFESLCIGYILFYEIVCFVGECMLDMMCFKGVCVF